MRILFFTLGLFVGLNAFAYGDPDPLSGYVIVEHSPISDPIPENPLVAYFVFEGKAAKKIYDNLAYKKIKDECVAGWYVRQVGNLSCWTNKKQYKCDFGLNLKTGRITEGIPC